MSALDSNIEAGVEVEGKQVLQLIEWHESLWSIATHLTAERLHEVQRRAKSLRDEFADLKRRAAELCLPQPEAASLSDSLSDAIGRAKQYFVCNTDRRQGARTKTGGFALEQAMFDRGFAAAWENFRYPEHMQRVGTGDIIFMYAKGVGIVGVGTALKGKTTLQPKTADWLRNFAREHATTEWRIPVRWLVRTDEAGAYKYSSPNSTFWDVTSDQYAEFRHDVLAHFLDGV